MLTASGCFLSTERIRQYASGEVREQNAHQSSGVPDGNVQEAGVENGSGSDFRQGAQRKRVCSGAISTEVQGG